MANTSIKISLELVDAAAQKALSNFISKGESADKNLKDLGSTGKSSFDQINVSLGKANNFLDVFAGTLAANAASKGFELLASGASKLFQTFIVDGVKAAEEQESANNALNISLAQTGVFSSQAAAEFEEFASGLQATTGIADDVISKNAALIQSLGQLDNDGLKRATSAAVNLSAALGKDLSSTSEALGKAAAGNTTAIQKMGLQFQKGQSDAETFNNILKALEDRFGGVAAQKVNTFGGSVTLVGAAFADLQEEVGNTIVKNNVVIAVLKSIGSVIGDVTGFVKDQSQSWKELVGEGLVGFIKASGFVVAAMDQISRGFSFLFNSIRAVIDTAVAVMISPFAIFSDTVKTVLQTLGEDARIAGNEVKTAFSKETGLEQFGVTLAKVQQDAENGFDALKSGASTSVEPVNAAKVAVAGLSDEQTRLNNETTKWAQNLAATSNIAKAQYELDLENLKTQRDAQIITEEQFLQAKRDLNDQQAIDDQARLDRANSQGLLGAQTYALASVAIEKKRAGDEAKIKDEEVRLEQQRSREKVAAVKDTFSNIASLMQTSSRELFAIGKAAAIASATINTYEAITKTMATVPYPFNIPLAAAQGIAGFVQVNNIANQQPRFEDGGIVGGSSFVGDQIQARVNSGEMILNRSQQKQLFQVANGEAGSSNSRVEQLIGMVGQLLAQPVSVQVDGREIFRATRSELDKGRSFA